MKKKKKRTRIEFCNVQNMFVMCENIFSLLGGRYMLDVR